MSTRRWIAAASVAVIGLVALKGVPAGAHHSSAPFYDATKSAEAQGTVTRFLFKNPHSFLYFEAADVYHRLDGKGHSGFQPLASAAFAEVFHLRIHVKFAPDAVADEVANDATPLRFRRR